VGLRVRHLQRPLYCPRLAPAGAGSESERGAPSDAAALAASNARAWVLPRRNPTTILMLLVPLLLLLLFVGGERGGRAGGVLLLLLLAAPLVGDRRGLIGLLGHAATRSRVQGLGFRV